MTAWGLAISNYLKVNEISQKDFSRQFGATENSVSHWVNGVVMPSTKTKQKLLALPGFDLAAARRALGLIDVNEQTTAATKPESMPYDMRNRVRDHLLCLTGFPEGLNARETSEIISSQIDATLRLIEVLEE